MDHHHEILNELIRPLERWAGLTEGSEVLPFDLIQCFWLTDKEPDRLGFFSLIEITLLQELVPEHKLGRVISLDMLGSYILLPFGLLIIGGLADIVGPATIFIIGGLLSVALVASGLCVRDIRKLA